MNEMPETIMIRIVSAPETLKPTYFLDSPYVDQFWCSIIGPSCVMLLKAFDRMDHGSCRTAVVRLDDLAREIGVGSTKGRNSAIWKAVMRLTKFNLAALSDGDSVLEVRDRVPGLGNPRRWPEHLRDAHIELTEGALAA